MGRMMGAFDRDNDMLDRPDLNKCPDCGCFFTQDDCPLCGKPCPEDMRAGNRRPPKKQKYKYDNGYRAMTFVDWYHRWWFIALMAFIHPLIAIVLLITSPHKKAHKIIAVSLAVLYWIISTFAFPLLWDLINKPESPVDTSLSKEQYIAVCETVDPEEFYRSPESYTNKFVSMELVVKRSFTGEGYLYDELYTTYYICTDKDGSEFEIIIRSCLQSDEQNFLPGDTVKIYGEGAGKATIYDVNYNAYSSPCINVAYASRVN